MSKAFEQWLDDWFDPDDGGTHGDTAKASWNAATENAVRICREQATESECPERAMYCAEAILKEKTE